MIVAVIVVVIVAAIFFCCRDCCPCCYSIVAGGTLLRAATPKKHASVLGDESICVAESKLSRTSKTLLFFGVSYPSLSLPPSPLTDDLFAESIPAC